MGSGSATYSFDLRSLAPISFSSTVLGYEHTGRASILHTLPKAKSEMTDDDLRAAIEKARARAASVGVRSAWWNVIQIAESILDGKQAQFSRTEIEAIFIRGGVT